MDNANPTVYATRANRRREDDDSADVAASSEWWCDERLALPASVFETGDDEKGGGDEAADRLDAREVFDLVRSITDPEHPLTLEQLAVVNEAHITVDEGDERTKRPATVHLEFTPTIPHCSMATLIGLSLRVRLLRALPSRYKVNIRIRDGTHQSENAINKQLNDKERVAAALENKHLLGVVHGCLASAGQRGSGSVDEGKVVEAS
ncbi:Cytosolic iron-sulfur assembly component 2B [Malassezia sp. CBS 17886]|nr:Cytosolic iron-sulfur assembly component 2B [Malassezia sp. CBS 17886]